MRGPSGMCGSGNAQTDRGLHQLRKQRLGTSSFQSARSSSPGDFTRRPWREAQLSARKDNGVCSATGHALKFSLRANLVGATSDSRPPMATMGFSLGPRADVLRLFVLCRGDPNAAKYSEQTGHQLASDRLAKQIRCKRCGRHWLNRNRGRYASWRCSLQR